MDKMAVVNIKKIDLQNFNSKLGVANIYSLNFNAKTQPAGKIKSPIENIVTRYSSV